MVKPTHKAPGPRPGVSFEIQVTNVVQDIVVVSRDAANDEEFVVVKNSSVPCAALGERPSDLRLGPVCRLEVEHDEV